MFEVFRTAVCISMLSASAFASATALKRDPTISSGDMGEIDRLKSLDDKPAVRHSSAKEEEVPRVVRAKKRVMTLRPDKTVEGITLQGIVSAADGKRKAIINNEVVGEGEQVDFSIEILNIYADSVTVRAPIRQRRRK